MSNGVTFKGKAPFISNLNNYFFFLKKAYFYARYFFTNDHEESLNNCWNIFKNYWQPVIYY